MQHTNGIERKKADPTSALDDGAEIQRLMQRFYPLVIESAFGDASLAGVPVSFSLEMREVQQVLKRLAKDIKNVTDTTKEDVRRLVGRAAEEGWGVEQLQKAIREKGEIASRSRALTISRTETGTAYNLGSVAAYRAGGVTHVEVLDGDDDEPCASANGSRWTLEEAEKNPLGHPNCVRSFIPIVE
jgi:hypothetical protein